MKRISFISLFGAIIVALGLNAMLNWAFHLPTLVSVTPGETSMVFNAAICFMLSGTCLLLTDYFPAIYKHVAILVGMIIIILAGLTLSENLFNYSLGLDQFFMTAWIHDANPHPGRMANDIAISLILTGAALMLLPYYKNRAVSVITQVLIYAIGIIGISTLLTHLLGLGLPYSWHSYTQLTMHACLGITLLSVGLWFALQKQTKVQPRFEEQDDKKILIYNAMTLFVIAALAGLLGFVVSVRQDEATIKGYLQQSLEEKVTLLQSSIDQSVTEMKTIQNNPIIDKNFIATMPRDISEFNQINQFLLATTFSAIQIKNTNGHVIYASGEMTANPNETIPLYLPPYKAALVWHHGFTLQVTGAIGVKGTAKSIKIEWPLAAFNRIFADSMARKNQDYSLCFLTPAQQMNCISPSHPGISINKTINSKSTDQLISLINANQAGTITATEDNIQHVFLAYHPLAPLRAGLLIKSDLAAMYHPLQKQLVLVLPIFLLAVLFGAIVLYRRILPLIHNVIHARREAQATSIRLKTIMNHIADGIIIVNEQGKIEDINPKTSSIFGYSASECIGQHFKILMPHANADNMKIYLTAENPQHPGANNIEIQGLRKNGQLFPMELAVTEMRLDRSHLFVGILRDISERKAAQETLLESETRFRLAFDTSAIGMAIISLEGRFLRTNAALCQIIGYTEAELLELNYSDLTHSDDLQISHEIYQKLLAEIEPNFKIQKRYRHKEGRTIWAQLNLTLMHNSTGHQLYIMAQIQDITTQKLAEDQLLYQAQHDALTGLVNRSGLETRLAKILAYSKVSQKKFAVFFLDLDKFKQVNDTYGHDAGDRLLITVAKRLKSHSRQSDVVARIGGDEFVMILEQLTTHEEASVFAERILSALLKPINIKGHELFISSSIGISFYPTNGIDYDTLIKNADNALYLTKENGRNNFQFCQPDTSTA